MNRPSKENVTLKVLVFFECCVIEIIDLDVLFKKTLSCLCNNKFLKIQREIKKLISSPDIRSSYKLHRPEDAISNAEKNV